MPQAIALIPTDTTTSRLCLRAMLDKTIAGQSILAHTVMRVAQIDSIKKIIITHPASQDPRPLLAGQSFEKPVDYFPVKEGWTDAYTPMRIAARKWALTSWRGGLGGATCYDELLPAKPLADAMKQFKADAALLVGADWLFVDPKISGDVLKLHLDNADGMPMTFSQAPPGLAGIAVARHLIEELAEKHGSFGGILAYNPSHAQPDPIGRDLCIQLPGVIRSCVMRFIYDTPRTRAMIDRIAKRLGDRITDADAAEIATIARSFTPEDHCSFASLPREVTMEITPKREVNGPILPQFHINLDRDTMTTDAAVRLVQQLGVEEDIALTLGGLGDALLHDRWAEIVHAAHEAGVFGIAIETDLLVDQAALQRILELPIDVVTIHLNADRAMVYEKVMGSTRFSEVIEQVQWLLNERNHRAKLAIDAAALDARLGVPWIVPRLTKTSDTLPDMESFFDRWMHYMGHAVIDPATSGCGLMPEQSPMPMAPPRRTGCRQIERRMTIHSSGKVALCDQDWLGQAATGDALTTPLSDIWLAMHNVRQAHHAGQWHELELCGGCHEWHRP